MLDWWRDHFPSQEALEYPLKHLLDNMKRHLIPDYFRSIKRRRVFRRRRGMAMKFRTRRRRFVRRRRRYRRVRQLKSELRVLRFESPNTSVSAGQQNSTLSFDSIRDTFIARLSKEDRFSEVQVLSISARS